MSRNLSDEDVSAITDALEARLVERFYVNLGKGLWSQLWKILVAVALALSVYGAAKGWKFTIH